MIENAKLARNLCNFMHTKSRLFDLINSLSQAEKRYVHRRLNQHKNGSLAGGLYAAIGKLDSFSDPDFKLANPGAPWLRSFAKNKLLLVELILQALREYRREKSIRYQVEDLIRDAEILISKAKSDHALKRLNKALEVAEKFE